MAIKSGFSGKCKNYFRGHKKPARIELVPVDRGLAGQKPIRGMQATAQMASVVSSTLPARRRLIRDVSPTLHVPSHMNPETPPSQAYTPIDACLACEMLAADGQVLSSGQATTNDGYVFHFDPFEHGTLDNLPETPTTARLAGVHHAVRDWHRSGGVPSGCRFHFRLVSS